MRLQRLSQRGRQWLEALRLRRFRPRTHHHFFVATAARNAGEFIERSLASVHDQHYPWDLLRHVVVDDASEDDTAERVRRWRDAHPGYPLELLENTERVGGCANYTRAFRQAPPESIVLQVDGDDWLPDPQVLAYLNMVYHDPDVWMTYNSWQFPDGRSALNSEPIPRRVIERNAVRDHPWVSSHLHSFRSRLFAHVREQSLLDQQTGQYWSAAVDLAHYLPMLELAGAHSRHLGRVTYVYNLHEQSIFQSNRKVQADCERRIRALPSYRPLGSLA